MNGPIFHALVGSTVEKQETYLKKEDQGLDTYVLLSLEGVDSNMCFAEQLLELTHRQNRT
jgi:hypothetical protein